MPEGPDGAEEEARGRGRIRPLEPREGEPPPAGFLAGDARDQHVDEYDDEYRWVRGEQRLERPSGRPVDPDGDEQQGRTEPQAEELPAWCDPPAAEPTTEPDETGPPV